MDSISEKITSRPGFLKAILAVIEKIVCFKEGKKLFTDDGIHFFRNECSGCNGTIAKLIRLVTLLGIGKMCAGFQLFFYSRR